MSSNFYIDPERLLSASERIRGLYQDMDSAFDSLTGVLNQNAGCWGHDSAGQAFAANFVQPEQQLRKSAGTLIPQLDHLANVLVKDVQMFQAQDHQNGNVIKKG